jgi:hypothetical protein
LLLGWQHGQAIHICHFCDIPAYIIKINGVQRKKGQRQGFQWDQHPLSLGDIPFSLFLCLLLLSFFLSHHHLTYVIIKLLFVHVIFNGAEVKVEYGQFFPHDNKEDEDLQLEGQGGGRSNQTKTKVRAIFLKLYATMPYMTSFVLLGKAI